MVLYAVWDLNENLGSWFADWDTLIISLANFSLLIDKLTVAFFVCFFTHTRFMLPDGLKAANKHIEKKQIILFM